MLYLKNKGLSILTLVFLVSLAAIVLLVAIPTFTEFRNDTKDTSENSTAAYLYKNALSLLIDNSTQQNPSTFTLDSIGSEITNSHLLLPFRNFLEHNTSINVVLTTYNQDVPLPDFEGNETYWQVLLPLTFIEDSNDDGVLDIGYLAPSGDIIIVSPDGLVYFNGIAK